MRSRACVLTLTLLLDGDVVAQSVAASQIGKEVMFEVASVKPNASGMPGMSMSMSPASVSFTNAPLRDLITAAYGLPWYRITGLPSWQFERFDVIAKPPAGSNLRDVNLMLRALLVERFMLKARPATRDSDVYALVLAREDRRLGPALKASTLDCRAMMSAEAAKSSTPSESQPDERKTCGADFSPGHIKLVGVPMGRLVALLSGLVGRVVQDQTGLTGNFEMEMRYAPDGVDTRTSELPSIFTALPEQLGLRLEPRIAPVDVLVIESVQRPNPN